MTTQEITTSLYGNQDMNKPENALTFSCPCDLAEVSLEHGISILMKHIQENFSRPIKFFYQITANIDVFLYIKDYLGKHNIPFLYNPYYEQDEWSLSIDVILKNNEIKTVTIWSPGGA